MFKRLPSAVVIVAGLLVVGLVAVSAAKPSSTNDAAITGTEDTVETTQQRDILGIPSEGHPVFNLGVATEAGQCAPGWTARLTTPSGSVVNVPCQAVFKIEDTEGGVDATGAGGQRAILGIPEDNKNHNAGVVTAGGDCQKGMTVHKTTPSGNTVNVPCQAAKANQDTTGTTATTTLPGHGHGAAKGKNKQN